MVKVTKVEGSPKGSLNSNDWKKIGKGAMIALAGAALTFLAELIPGLDFGKYTLIVVPMLSVLVNAGLKWYQGQPK